MPEPADPRVEPEDDDIKPEDDDINRVNVNADWY
jgi:hypothetical protein